MLKGGHAIKHISNDTIAKAQMAMFQYMNDGENEMRYGSCACQYVLEIG